MAPRRTAASCFEENSMLQSSCEKVGLSSECYSSITIDEGATVIRPGVIFQLDPGILWHNTARRSRASATCKFAKPCQAILLAPEHFESISKATHRLRTITQVATKRLRTSNSYVVTA